VTVKSGPLIRQALRAGHVDELAISIAPVILGGGKRLFDGFEQTLNLEHVALLQSPFATHITYRLVPLTAGARERLDY
jgi:dihydrofolate reductase